MSETIIDCLEKKAKIRFIELNTVMAEALREDIIKDTGHPKLKAKVLDLITKLRTEAAILNPSKTAKMKESEVVKPKLQNIKGYNTNGKERIGLDVNGQIKVSHGVVEIQEMVD